MMAPTYQHPVCMLIWCLNLPTSLLCMLIRCWDLRIVLVCMLYLCTVSIGLMMHHLSHYINKSYDNKLFKLQMFRNILLARCVMFYIDNERLFAGVVIFDVSNSELSFYLWEFCYLKLYKLNKIKIPILVTYRVVWKNDIRCV